MIVSAEAHHLGFDDRLMRHGILDEYDLQGRVLLQVPVKDLEDLAEVAGAERADDLVFVEDDLSRLQDESGEISHSIPSTR